MREIFADWIVPRRPFPRLFIYFFKNVVVAAYALRVTESRRLVKRILCEYTVNFHFYGRENLFVGVLYISK